MADTSFIANRWIFIAAYFAVMCLLMAVHLLPLRPGQFSVPGPDLMIGATFAWVLRRPQYVPAFLVAVVFLTADMFFLRPPGLWAALVVVAVEFLRKREGMLRERTFPLEWGTVIVTLLVVLIANRVILTVFLVPQPGLGPTLLQLIATVLTYPLIVLASRYVFGVVKMTPADTDARGRPR